MDPKISIILSTYNEGYVIEDTLKSIFANLTDVEVVIVDDSSTDDTCAVIEKFNDPRVKLFVRKNRGLASAFLLGLINTRGEIVGWFDSNMPELLTKAPQMISELESNDLVILSRYVLGGNDQRSKLRVFSSKAINFFCRIILDNSVKDYTSSLFLMKREKLSSAVPICYGHGEFFIEFIYKLLKKNKKIVEIPYIHPPDQEGMSKTANNIFRFFKLGFDYIVRVLISKIRRN
jgi:glycosyltransferase involved in cell wall biosynthesis